MKKILIIYPHFLPSNLAGVHRPRLFAQHLPSFGWEPVVLTVHEDHYEESLDVESLRLLPAGLRVEKVAALPLTRPRVIGDIGLRAFFSLYRKAKALIRSEKIDFVLIPVPSFYCALLGRWLHHSTGIRYGIDYIDPWVHRFPGSEKRFSRHWFSTRAARLLEPIAVGRASLIAGVAEGYFKAVLDRNPMLRQRAVSGAMPYGGEKRDHLVAETSPGRTCLFAKNGKFQLVYAGALLPKAVQPLEALFAAIAGARELFSNTAFHFIGTGKPGGTDGGYSVKLVAQKYGLWEEVVFEHPQRIPYMDVLFCLKQADAIFVLGSTEPHYTPSKIYQAVLSGKPVAALLHQQSPAVVVLEEAGAGKVFPFDGEQGLHEIRRGFPAFFQNFRTWSAGFNKHHVSQCAFERYSARSATGQLAALLDTVCAPGKQQE